MASVCRVAVCQVQTQNVQNAEERPYLSRCDFFPLHLTDYGPELVAVMNGFGAEESGSRQSMLKLGAVARRAGGVQEP